MSLFQWKSWSLYTKDIPNEFVISVKRVTHPPQDNIVMNNMNLSVFTIKC